MSIRLGPPWPGRLLHGLLLGVSLICIASCVAEREAAPKRLSPPFPHKRHLQEDMECQNCHTNAAKGAEAGRPPTLAKCMLCHEEIDAKKPAAHQIKSFLVDDKPVWSNVTALSPDVKFSHKTHIDALVACETCHKGIRNSKEVTSKLRVEKKDCLECHAKQHVGEARDNCAMCHTNINKQWKPPSHQRDWLELHGRTAAGQEHGAPGACEQCHTPAKCTNCHHSQMPKSHTNFWRERGHGQIAALDRRSCKTCHTEDSCDRCHREIAPQSHKGNWDARHCLFCHLPVKNESCSACHKDTRSHNLAPVLPANLTHQKATAADCRNCHFGNRLMQHPDNGQSCLLCHHK